MRVVSFPAVLRLHDRLIDEFGGAHGIRDVAAIEAAVQRPHSGVGDVELFPGLFEKAAAVAHSIATTHPFIDGNKRTALAAAIMTLRLNGHDLVSTGEEEEAAIMDLVLGDMTLEGFADWLARHARARSR